MADFSLENFTHRLIAEALFYDEEYGLVGTVSLVDVETRREMYVASFLPDNGTYLIEEGTAWEDEVDLEEDEDVAYALLVDSRDHGTYDVPEVAAEAVLDLARAHDLLPSFVVMLEDEEM